MKEQWGERSLFAPFVDIPTCQDQNEFPQKSGVVERNAIRTLIYNESATCKLFTDKTDCLDHGSCEWREDFGGRCRLDMASKAPTPEPTFPAEGTNLKIKNTTKSSGSQSHNTRVADHISSPN